MMTEKGSNEEATSSLDEEFPSYSSSDSDSDSSSAGDEDEDEDDTTDDDDDDDDDDDGDDGDDDDDEQYFKNSDGFEDEDMDLYDTIDGDGNNNDNDDHHEPWWEGKEKVIALIVGCCCCICLILIGVIVGVAVGAIGGDSGGGGINDWDMDLEGTEGPKPTLRPTLAPQPLPPSMLAQQPSEVVEEVDNVITSQPTGTQTPTLSPSVTPTGQPTKSFAPIPETLGIISDADTYVILNGEFKGDEHGDYDTILVQNGPLAEETIPDSVGLIAFPLDDVPSINRLNNNGNTKKNAVLRLTHSVPAKEEGDVAGSITSAATYTITRLPETRMSIENFHGYFFRPPTEEENKENGVAPFVKATFKVKSDDTLINIDITSLLFEYSDNQDGEEQQSKAQTQLLLMITNEGAEQEMGGDRFYTRETSTPPQLLIDFVGGNAVDVTI